MIRNCLSPKLPRDVDGEQFAGRLCSKFGYVVRHRVGSHILLQLHGEAEPHVTVPAHKAIKIGTLSSILRTIELQTGVSRDDLLRLL